MGQDVVDAQRGGGRGHGAERAAGSRERKSQGPEGQREAGHRLETAAICSVALGLRSGWRSEAWRPSPPPRPVPSATRARPWPARPASPRPRRRWVGAPQPEKDEAEGAGPARGGRGEGRSGRGWVAAVARRPGRLAGAQGRERLRFGHASGARRERVPEEQRVFFKLRENREEGNTRWGRHAGRKLAFAERPLCPK